MTVDERRHPTGFRRLSAGAGAILAVEAIALFVVLQVSGRARESSVLPVIASFSGEGGGASGDPTRVVLSQIDPAAAVIVLVAVAAVARLLGAFARAPHRATAVGLPATPRRTVAATGNLGTGRWIEYSFTASVTVFLVAQLNGVTDVGALVLSYAATSGMVLFTMLQERVTVRAGHPRLALCFGAALGIVPWGVIAFQQIGAGVVGDAPAPIVRVITLVMLAFAFASALAQWHELRVPHALRGAGTGDASARGTRDDGFRASAAAAELRGARMHVLLSLASTSVFAWLVVLGVVLPA